MTDRRITIDYTEYSTPDEMEPQDRELVAAALRARTGSYSPYSKFRVGAALRLVDGTIVLGANQENVAYPSGLCAERTAMFAAGANHPGVAFDTLAVDLAQVDEIEGNTDLARHHLRHEPVLLPLAVAVEGGVGFVPVLHEHGKDVVALLFQEEGRNGGVHAAGQADADFDFAVFWTGSCHFVRFSPAKVMISKNISYF